MKIFLVREPRSVYLLICYTLLEKFAGGKTLFTIGIRELMNLTSTIHLELRSCLAMTVLGEIPLPRSTSLGLILVPGLLSWLQINSNTRNVR